MPSWVFRLTMAVVCVGQQRIRTWKKTAHITVEIYIARTIYFTCPPKRAGRQFCATPPPLKNATVIAITSRYTIRSTKKEKPCVHHSPTHFEFLDLRVPVLDAAHQALHAGGLGEEVRLFGLGLLEILLHLRRLRGSVGRRDLPGSHVRGTVHDTKGCR